MISLFLDYVINQLIICC